MLSQKRNISPPKASSEKSKKRPRVSSVLVIQPDQDVRKRGRPKKVLDNTIKKPKKTRGRPKKATEEPSSETPVHQFIFQPPDTN
ncbi:hypothetical protein A0J61_11276 [Choanephora cucurbitarum]|uniref:Uncharacterized protein n=1 Tax=Choanephora cucurbitarum TaxID=101091 RepID=A0A1C7MUV9_9FUNG|nr:hypothetical protein A0J61_11276 [Choanephora cucurbitarum]